MSNTHAAEAALRCTGELLSLCACQSTDQALGLLERLAPLVAITHGQAGEEVSAGAPAPAIPSCWRCAPAAVGHLHAPCRPVQLRLEALRCMDLLLHAMAAGAEDASALLRHEVRALPLAADMLMC